MLLIGHTGARQLQIRYTDDQKPTVWIADVEYQRTRECAAGLDPLTAVLRLLDLLIDGGTCLHCGRPTGIEHNFSATPLAPELLCWYVFDPENRVYRRSCEGDYYNTVGRNDPCPCGSGKKFKRCCLP